MNKATLLFCLVACASAPEASLTPAPEEVVREGLNDRFLANDLVVDEWVQRFEVESREIAARRDAIVAAMQLVPGYAVADIGGGTGLFMQPFSEVVGASGTVYEVEISTAFVQHLRRRAVDEGHANVEAVLCTEKDCMLPQASVDVLFVCDTYHHFSYPATTLHTLRRALRPGGSLFVVDFERIPGVSSEWVLGHVRAGKAEFRAEIEAAGFTFEEQLDPGLEQNYMLRFSR